jgi:ribosomal protein S18 acetylase RimI-like enzyme
MPSSSSTSPKPRSSARLRPLGVADRAPLESLLSATGAFTAEEIAVAMELIDLGLTPGGGGYRFTVAEDELGVAGYACFGATPMTDRTFDLYWIAVHPRAQGTGVGQALVAGVEATLRAERGRLLLIETASKPSYARQRSFYARAGYAEVARVADFYCDGDDRVIFAKRLDGGA